MIILAENTYSRLWISHVVISICRNALALPVDSLSIQFSILMFTISVRAPRLTKFYDKVVLMTLGPNITQSVFMQFAKSRKRQSFNMWVDT